MIENCYPRTLIGVFAPASAIGLDNLNLQGTVFQPLKVRAIHSCYPTGLAKPLKQESRIGNRALRHAFEFFSKWRHEGGNLPC